jgi:formamidopyrimidine-DNA glycosylase
MPELPEVETVKRGLQPFVEGAVIRTLVLNRPDLRFPFPQGLKAKVKGVRVDQVSRRAKYLLWHLGNGMTLISHLGMSGSWRVATVSEPAHTPGNFHHPRNETRAHDHVVVHLTAPDGRELTVTYNDPRRFGFLLMTPTAELNHHPLMRDIGLEPLGNSFDGDALHRLFTGRRTSLKAALLDQKLIAGIGNIYACEALWAARLDPARNAESLARHDGAKSAASDALATAVRDVLGRAIEAGGSTLRDHRQTDGELGYFQHSFNVYGRETEPCQRPGCKGTIGRIVQNGRSTFHCPQCQS